MDGTFGLCDKRILLFILMGLDEDQKGFPLAFLLFSVPTGNKQTSAGYNTEILANLVKKWKISLGSCNGVAFTVIIAITDTDLIEWATLIRVFPDIWLLICKFHLQQCWRNHRNQEVKGKTPSHYYIKSQLSRLEDALVKTTNIKTACTLIADKHQIFRPGQ